MTRSLALVLAVLLSAPGFARAADEPEEDTGETFTLTKNRYAYAAGVVFLLSGLAAGYVAQGDAARAQTVSSAVDTRSALLDAQTASATSNLLFALAGLTIAYGIVLELLPPKIANRASLTFHF